MSKYYLEIALNGERVLGAEWKFTFPKFGVWAETKEEALKEIREWQKEFIAEVKAKKNKVEEIPFPDDLHSKKKTKLPAGVEVPKLPY